MSNFEERSGIISVPTNWGRWYQTIEEVFIEVDVPEGTKSSDLKIKITNKSISVENRGNIMIKGTFPKPIHSDESCWTLEDRKRIQICLPKSEPSASNIWKSLLENQYEADAITFDKISQKMTLQRFQFENPGFDFSGATISGNYQGGGPTLPGS
ncbi:nudC domain-containing protein 2-like [Tubulanus polymorphus]|uniref:nudC domain-containing protein 2-like n=1 Tax=Tubulanus polymorphus TaxID=672921 RepID=UPI003DA5CAB6